MQGTDTLFLPFARKPLLVFLTSDAEVMIEATAKLSSKLVKLHATHTEDRRRGTRLGRSECGAECLRTTVTESVASHAG